jgi:hypothetical protein
MLVIGVTTPHELNELMDLDIEVQRRGRREPVDALSAVAEAMPGLGIVAAVLGVVITMEAIGGSPETIGQKVAAALVGTFLGILLCYGVVGPLAARLEHGGAVPARFAYRGRGLRTRVLADAGPRVCAAVDPTRGAPELPRDGGCHQARRADSAFAGEFEGGAGCRCGRRLAPAVTRAAPGRVSPRDLLEVLRTNDAFVILPITIDVAEEDAALVGAIADPGDRAIVATARVHNLTLLTSDERIVDSQLVRVVD